MLVVIPHNTVAAVPVPEHVEFEMKNVLFLLPII